MKLSNQSVIISIEVLSITFLGHRYFPTIYVIFPLLQIKLLSVCFILLLLLLYRSELKKKKVSNEIKPSLLLPNAF